MARGRSWKLHAGNRVLREFVVGDDVGRLLQPRFFVLWGLALCVFVCCGLTLRVFALGVFVLAALVLCVLALVVTELCAFRGGVFLLLLLA